MVACFVLGIIYEFIKSYREYWMRGAFQTVKYNQVIFFFYYLMKYRLFFRTFCILLYGICFIFMIFKFQIFLQVEDSRNRSQIEQGSEINNDSQSDQVRNLFHYFFLNFLQLHFPLVIGTSMFI